jgi:rfaE bifunctional protein nucleotidyltransferase chain/domain
LCHGGFDLLHPGHVRHFESAKKLCNILIVSVTSDRFVSDRKGSGRPIYTDKLRAYMIASLSCVDYVVISDFEKGTNVINLLRPSYYIKGPDFINKNTPGITAEREAIKNVGGEMKYTNDTKLGTTEIIDYIKNEIDNPIILMVIDRDGTLIKNNDFFGKNKNWRDELEFNDDVISFLSFLQTKYRTVKIVVSNQAGVARKYFSCRRVEEINEYINKFLKERGIKIDNWQYCPDVDSAYAEKKKGEIVFDNDYAKDSTKRKPSSAMMFDALNQLNKKLEDFSSILVIGDREEDEILAKNLNAGFIDVKNKKYEDLVNSYFVLIK